MNNNYKPSPNLILTNGYLPQLLLLSIDGTDHDLLTHTIDENYRTILADPDYYFENYKL